LLVYSFKILDGEEIFIKNSLILYMFDTYKKEVIESLEKLIDLCNSAEKENKEIKCTKRTIKLGNIK